MIDFAIPILTMAVLGLLFSSGLVFAYKRLHVEEDPRVEQVNEILPPANCGACGYSGCRAFAEAVTKGEIEPGACPGGGEDVACQVADGLGVETGEVIKKIARLHCRGTLEAAKSRGQYLGIKTCATSHILGGNKQCSYGCMGFGDCVLSCQFDALYMGDDGLPYVIDENCTACGKCVDACPRNLFRLHPLDQNIFVYCNSEDSGPTARKVCKVSCMEPEGILKA